MSRAARSADEHSALRVIGAKVHALRTSRGMTQMALAHAADLHPTYIGQVENGTRNVAVLNLISLARALGVQPAALMPDI